MKLKNVNFFERHIEKIILGVGGLYAVIVLWGYILSQPYTVSVGARHLSPNQVEQRVLSEADRLQRLIQSGAPSPIQCPQLGSAYSQNFRSRLEQPISRVAMVPLGGGLGQVVRSFSPEGSLVGTPPSPPAVAEIQTDVGTAVLAAQGELISTLGEPAAQGYAQLVARRPPRDFRYVVVTAQYDMNQWLRQLQESQIPANWWHETLAFSDVILQRQAYDPVSQEEGPIETVAPLPGATSFRSQPARWSTETATQAVKQIHQLQEQILRPSLPPLTSGTSWIKAPSPTDASPEEDLATSVVSLESVAQPPPLTPVTVSAYDLTIRPGVTYRYRLMIAVLNPQFQREKSRLRQPDYSDQLALLSQPSPWSDPVKVEPDRRFFVISGSTRPAEATVEVWKLFNGMMRVREFHVRPGDLIGAPVQIPVEDQMFDVDMSLNVIVIDLTEDTQTLAAGQAPGNQASAMTMLFFDQNAQRLADRKVDDDRQSPIRHRLKDELMSP